MMRALLAGGATLLATTAAVATPTTTFDATAGLNAGWTSNPYLQSGGHGTATLSGSIAPVFTIATATSSTTISGDATYLKYLSGYGDSRTLDARVAHSQSFSSHLSGDISLDASDSTSALLNPFLVSLPVTTGDLGTIVPVATAAGTSATTIAPVPIATAGTPLPSLPTDIIASRQNVRTFYGAGDLNWQATAQDQITGSLNAARGVYPGGHHAGVPDDVQLSNYWNYGGSVSANHQFNSRTRVGAVLSYTRDISQHYPDASSLEPGITVDQRLSSYWTLHAGLNLILETLDLTNGHDHTTQAGFNLNLCGTYPRKTVCFNASRDTTPSGYGGLRTRTSGSVNASYQLTARSSVNGTLGYARDKGNDAIAASSLSLLQANAAYSRTLTRRLAFNVTLGYQRSSYSGFGNADGLSASAGLSISLGRGR